MSVDSLRPLIGTSTFVIEGLRNFGDTLHSSVIVNHYRRTYKDITWIVSDRYYQELIDTARYLDVKLFAMPHHAEGGNRSEWRKFLQQNAVKCLFPLCAVSGWDKASRAKNIVDAVLYNANISRLHVPRMPVFKHSSGQDQWFKEFSQKHQLKRYVLLEYRSYTLSQPPHNSTWSINKYNSLLARLTKQNIKIVYTAAATDPGLDGGIDARGATWRQAKLLIKNSIGMIGCGSGLSVLACADDVRKKLLEINIGSPLSAKNCYNLDSKTLPSKDVDEVARQITKEFK